MDVAAPEIRTRHCQDWAIVAHPGLGATETLPRFVQEGIEVRPPDAGRIVESMFNLALDVGMCSR
jgi:hypothetical protein